MFLLIPYSAELKLARKPYITYTIVLLCILIFYSQVNNRSEIEHTVSQYCKSLQTSTKQHHDDFTQNTEVCEHVLTNLQLWFREDADFDAFVNDLVEWDKDEDPEKELVSIRRHYERMQLTVPQSVDMQLMYYPDTLNPLAMITATLSHGDIWHIVGNLLFFLAFTPPLEILISDRLKFLKLLLSIALITGISYSVFSLGSSPVPTLGLSGVVMGMIGLSAFMMPGAKIRCFLWIVWYAKVVYVPAWILAAWYIGWDVYELLESGNNSGINLVAHVSGGISGYLLGRWWFKERREEYQYELQEEINYQRHNRQWHAYQTSNIGGVKEYENRIRQKLASREYEKYMQDLYMHVEIERDSEAIIMMLEDFELKRGSIEIYEELFNRIETWRPSRTLLCCGRLVIDLYIEQHQYGKAIDYIKRCQKVTRNFVLAQGNGLIQLVQTAIKLQQYELAFNLVRDIDEKYYDNIDRVHCKILEIELLYTYLNKTDKAVSMLKDLINLNPVTHKCEIKELKNKLISE